MLSDINVKQVENDLFEVFLHQLLLNIISTLQYPVKHLLELTAYLFFSVLFASSYPVVNIL